MKIIAHRGNLKGPNPERENSPEYLLEAVEAGYDCEVDVWYDDNNQLYLGHDNPKYKVDHEFLNNKAFWCHAKNLEALEYMLVNNISIYTE
jgi:glycerophosphoryl diester phosphodiesterase